MRIGLIECDGHRFPSLPLMKLSAYHKAKGDSVKWYEPFDMMGEPYDIVYMSKVFSFTPDYEYPINSKKVVRGGVWLLHRISRWQGNLSFGTRQTASG